MSSEEEPQQPEQPEKPAALQAQAAVAQATITIIRAGTGKVETYDLTFLPLPEEPNPPKETDS